MSYAPAVPASRNLFLPPPEEPGRETAPSGRKIPLFASQDGLAGVVPASRLGLRPAPPTVPLGIASLDELTGGLPRGALTEFCGPASSGRTSVLLAAMAQCTRRGEICALVDAGDSFDPASAASAGLDLRRLLWVRCGESGHREIGPSGDRAIGRSGHREIGPSGDRAIGRNRPITRSPDHQITRSSFAALDQALRATDLLLQGGGFGLVAVDLGDVPPLAARRIPLASWFRFRRAVENTPTVLLVLEEEPWAKSCASLVLRLSAVSPQLSETQVPADAGAAAGFKSAPSHARLFQGLSLQAEVLRARGAERKPSRPAAGKFESSTTWRIA